jgi:hypothetical protein
MNNVHFILPCIALVLAVVAICRPTWPLLAVAVILISIAMLVKS